MGYRMNIVDTQNPAISYYGTKLYAYCDMSELKSYKYLDEIGIIDKLVTGEESDGYFDKEDAQMLWVCGYENRFTLTAEQFREFIKLYQEDLQCTIDDDRIKQLIESNSDKELYWD